MSKSARPVQSIATPIRQAMVFICEKCGKRVAGSGHKNPSHRLASQFKRDLKHTFDKGDVRIVLTTCMDICPENNVAISVQPIAPGSAPFFLEASIDDIAFSSEKLAAVLRRSLRGN